MRNTVTIRLSREQRQQLTRAARRLGQTVSDVIRDSLDRTLTTRPLGIRAGHVKGRLRLRQTTRDEWRRQLRARNWRP